MSGRIDQEKVSVMVEAAASKGYGVEMLVDKDAFDFVFAPGKRVRLPLMSDRKIDELRRPAETPFDNEVLCRVAGRAFYDGFHTVQYLGDDHESPTRLLRGAAFRHPDGRVLTYESRKSHDVGLPYRYSMSGYYRTEEEYNRAIRTQGGQQDIISFLEKNFSQD